MVMATEEYTQFMSFHEGIQSVANFCIDYGSLYIMEAEILQDLKGMGALLYTPSTSLCTPSAGGDAILRTNEMGSRGGDRDNFREGVAVGQRAVSPPRDRAVSPPRERDGPMDGMARDDTSPPRMQPTKAW